MTFFKEIYHKENLNLGGKIITREAVRGVILKGKRVLMIFSLQNGDFKFPGGGVETGELHEETLK
jgi:ADP-ribose pyrophosphatase YjhB (NUDIX family)